MHMDMLDIPVLIYFSLHWALNTSLSQRLVPVWYNVQILFGLWTKMSSFEIGNWAPELEGKDNWTNWMTGFPLIFYISQSGTTVFYKKSSCFICYQNKKGKILKSNQRFFFLHTADFIFCYKQFMTPLGSATCLPTWTWLNHHLF